METIDMRRLTAEEALARLRQGNHRFMTADPIHPRQDPARRSALVVAQRPYAAILTCADSRVAPELVFDQGFGDLFVVRNGGNIPDEIACETLEFAVGAWGIPLIVVMGHQNCGAVTETLAAIDAGVERGRLFSTIRRAIATAANAAGDRIRNAVLANVAASVGALRARQPLSDLLSRGELSILGAYYSIETGAVEVL